MAMPNNCIAIDRTFDKLVYIAVVVNGILCGCGCVRATLSCDVKITIIMIKRVAILLQTAPSSTAC